MKKIEITNINCWFTYRGEIKAKYAHVIKLNPQVETREYSLPILENQLILRDFIKTMLQKMKEVGQFLTLPLSNPYFIK